MGPKYLLYPVPVGPKYLLYSVPAGLKYLLTRFQEVQNIYPIRNPRAPVLKHRVPEYRKIRPDPTLEFIHHLKYISL